jgi:hypothetical protein
VKHFLRCSGRCAGLFGALIAQAQVINLSSANSTGTTVALMAGADYTLSYASAGTAGASYLAWNPWSSVSGCDQNAAHCVIGFSERFNILGTNGDIHEFSAPAGPYATAMLANAAAVAGPLVGSPNGGPSASFGPVISFHQDNDIKAVFYISDSTCSDNSGGVSLVLTRVDAVPEPETYALRFAGLGVVGHRGRRRKSQG